MRVLSPVLLFLILTGCALGKEVEVTVFTLKDGRQIEALSFASATTEEGESIHSVTTTAGKKVVLMGEEVASKKSVKKDATQLPEYAQEKVATQPKVQKDWRAHAAAEREAEEAKRRIALVRAAEMAEEGKALRIVELEERTIRQRCAALWEAHRRALAQIASAQEMIRQAHFDYRDAVEDRRDADRWPARTPEERARRRFLQYRADRRIETAQDNIRKGEQLLRDATYQANQLSAQLAQEKAKLAQAEQRVAEARQRYEEARKRYKQPVEPSDPAGEVIRLQQ